LTIDAEHFLGYEPLTACFGGLEPPRMHP